MGAFKNDIQITVSPTDRARMTLALTMLASRFCRFAGQGRSLRRHRCPAQGRDRWAQGRLHGRQQHLPVAPGGQGTVAGLQGTQFQNELYAKQDGRKPKPEFLDLVGSAAAIIFTVPKDDTLTGATRCMKRMGLLRGDTIKMRYRRLDMRMHPHQDRGLDHDHARRQRMKHRPDAWILNNSNILHLQMPAFRSPWNGNGGDAARFTDWIQKTFAFARSHSAHEEGCRAMSSISSVSAPAPGDSAGSRTAAGAASQS